MKNGSIAPTFCGLRIIPAAKKGGSVNRHILAFMAVLIATATATATAPAFAGPNEDAKAAYDRKDYSSAIRIWAPLASEGNGKAQFGLGLMYANGQGVDQDVQKGIALIDQAAKQGVVEAITFFASALTAEPEKAVPLWRRAAELGDALAQYNLGVVYAQGLGGMKSDLREAATWYRKAAEQGNADAQYSLGDLYRRGEGVFQDYDLAIKWFRIAANAGHIEAQRSMGYIYDNGEGVPKDYVASAKWWRVAADRGDPASQYFLGNSYMTGRGVQKDNVQAHKWMNLSHSRIPASDSTRRKVIAEQLAAIEKLLKPGQILEAQKLARDWKPTLQ